MLSETSVGWLEKKCLPFHSPSKGLMNKVSVFAEIASVVSCSTFDHEVIVGADSQLRYSSTLFVIAISVIRSKRGGRFYYHHVKERHLPSLQERIYMEAFFAVSLASELREYLKVREVASEISLHFDIGYNGPTNKYVKLLLQLAKANGFEASIKPHSFGASTIADRYTK